MEKPMKCEHCGGRVEVIKIGGEYQAQCTMPDYVCSTEGIGPRAYTREAAIKGFINCHAQTFYRTRKQNRTTAI